jgi:P-type Cu2+ transporter
MSAATTNQRLIIKQTGTNPGITKEMFPVLEMTCASCASSVESMLNAVPGVSYAGVNFANQTAWVEYDKNRVTPQILQNSVRSIGYYLVIDTKNQDELKEKAQNKYYSQLKQRTIGSSVLAIPIIIIAMLFMNMPFANWIMLALATPVVFYFGSSFFINACKQAKHAKANMDTLVAMSTGAAWLFSFFNTIYPAYWQQRGLHAQVYYEAAAVVIAFISLGKLLEEKAKSNTSFAIKKLIGLQPKTAAVVNADGIIDEVPIEQVKINDIVLVKPGERIPVDGQVSSGESFVDESMITGEPVPIIKKIDNPVFAGTINQKGSFQFKAAKVGSNTLLAHIIKMVQEAQGSKAPVQKLVDKIAGIFVPVVIGISAFTFILWMVLGPENAFTHGLLASVTILVIACPCALGLATPTAIMVGIGKGAENNILIKDAQSLELAHKVNAIILDKTGTITEGKPVVTDLIWQPNDDPALLQSVLFSLEQQSEHPLAEAIVSYLTKEGIKHIPLAPFESITGLGVKAVHNGITYLAGNKKFIVENNIVIDESFAAKVFSLQTEAKTVIYFAGNKKTLAIIAIADKIKESSKDAIEKLQRSGIEVYMLTGDNEQTAAIVAGKVGIKSYKAEVMPTCKATFVKQLQQAGKIVAMVGDGINDSQALAQADVSIAMGKGSDIAIDVSKITLITSDLNSIPKAFSLSRKTVTTIKQNLFWAFIYNLIGIPIAAGILYPLNGFLLDPMIAGAAMALSSVSVVTNSLRLKAAKI